MTPWQTLLWMQWRALRWKLAALTAIPLSFLAFVPVFLWEDSTSSLWSTAIIAAMIAYGVTGPIYLALHYGTSERADRSAGFVRGLPISMRQAGVTRLAMTLLVLLFPVAAVTVAADLILVGISVWGTSTQFVTQTLPEIHRAAMAGAAAVTSLFLWMAVFSTRQPNELRAGLVAIVIAVGWGAWTMYSVAVWDNSPGNMWWTYGLTAVGPWGILAMLDPGLGALGRVSMCTLQLLTLCGLCYFAVRRYAEAEHSDAIAGESPRTPHRMLLWLNWHDARPIGLAGLVCLVLVVASSVAVGPGSSVALMRHNVVPVSIVMGCLWGVFIAAGTFCPALEPKLAHFWRSRPIPPSSWFWHKYSVGALSILAFVELPALVFGDISATGPDSWAGFFVSYALCVTTLHLAAYSFAVAIACLVRHTVYAGILAMGGLLVIAAPMTPAQPDTLGLKPLHVMAEVTKGVAEGQFTPVINHSLLYLVYTGSCIAAGVFLARWATRKNVGVHF